MDVTQAKTFLAVVEAGNFAAASKRVFVTQSTISARVKALEQQLGKTLFIRTKSKCELTPAGHQFYRFAQSMVRVWEEAKHQVAVPDNFDDTLIVGGQYSLWNRFLLRWAPLFQERAPRVALRCEVGMPQRLMREMTEGVLDVAVIYRPELRPGLLVEELFEDELVLVTTDPAVPLDEHYVFVDWGESYRDWHAVTWPTLHNPGLTLDLGSLGLNMLLNNGGAGYFPKRLAQAHLDRGHLAQVMDAPTFHYPAYVVYQEAYANPEAMAVAIQTLHEVAARAMAGALPPPFWTG
ncbi:LysR family transcriptional regulator [Parvularcula sp. LCG005]|uniref:LysR family transcriptional regulator n=1 Tax=Parvularcula sp. LCG005 TaxID=3078805 RepID=UPI002941BC64|nr:LysR family transcriptional regulator [Parvularcula sp. LCG005]WOI53532.1 LysR family transcriptional regulator [Parvularcula sp. LCG005]